MELQYDEFGQGVPLVLVHGLGGTGNLWGAIAPTLARQYRVICPDLRGSGRTGCEGELSTVILVEDLLQFCNQLKTERVHWVGHSYGSSVVQELAVEHPALTASVTLVGPFRTTNVTVQAALTDRAAKARREGLSEIGSVTAQKGLSAETLAHRPEIAALVREMVMRQDPELYALTCEAIVDTLAAKIETLRCPTLILTGDEDVTASPRTAKSIADTIVGAEFHLLPRCGHWAPIERAPEVAGFILDFLLRNGDTGIDY